MVIRKKAGPDQFQHNPSNRSCTQPRAPAVAARALHGNLAKKNTHITLGLEGQVATRDISMIRCFNDYDDYDYDFHDYVYEYVYEE